MYEFDGSPMLIRKVTDVEGRRARQARLDATAANKAKELDLKERELNLRESEAAGVSARLEMIEKAVSGTTAEEVKRALLVMGLDPNVAVQARVSALTVWLRVSGMMGADGVTDKGDEVKTLRELLGSIKMAVGEKPRSE